MLAAAAALAAVLAGADPDAAPTPPPTLRPAAPTASAPGPPPPGPAAVKVDLAAAKLRWDGLGGLSSGGSTRLLADYPAQQRSDFLDLLFNKKGGAAFQILKTEIGGDGDSSYGSESSTMHTANRSDDNFDEGYETWLLKEAKARNPAIPTYCLSWTSPAWTASDTGPNRTFMNAVGAQYHAEYMRGVRNHLNVSFDYAGVWNEQSLTSPTWHDSYVAQLRTAMDGAGFKSTKIVCSDGDASVIDIMQTDDVLRKAVDIVGIHWGRERDPSSPPGLLRWHSLGCSRSRPACSSPP